MADAARDVDLAGGLSEREEVRAVAGGAVLAEDLAGEVVEGALEVAEGDALVDDEALDLRELRQVVGVGGVGAEDRARADHVDRRLLGLHDVSLDAGGLGAQQDVGLALDVHLLALGGVVHHIEGVLGRTAGVVLRGVQRGEVVVGGLDVGAVLDGVAEADEDVLDLLADLGDKVLGAERELTAGQRDVGGVGLHLLCHEGAAELVLALLDGHVDVGADGVGELAHGRTLLGRDLAHGVHDGRQAALAAEHAHAQGLESVHGLGLGQPLLDLSLNRLEVFGHRHCVFPFPNKNRPRTHVQGRQELPRYHLD